MRRNSSFFKSRDCLSLNWQCCIIFLSFSSHKCVGEVRTVSFSCGLTQGMLYLKSRQLKNFYKHCSCYIVYDSLFLLKQNQKSATAKEDHEPLSLTRTTRMLLIRLASWCWGFFLKQWSLLTRQSMCKSTAMYLFSITTAFSNSLRFIPSSCRNVR